MNTNVIHTGDALEVLCTLPGESVHCCVTSPPYFHLRDYGIPGQYGMEDTLDEYVCNMARVFREVRRVLHADGTFWLIIGDSYTGSFKGGGEESQETNQAAVLQERLMVEDLPPKSLIGVPWRVAFALQADGWYLRQEIIWSKPNPMPESVRDRCTKSHEHIFLFAKSRHYYFDGEAIAEPIAESTQRRLSQDIARQKGSSRIPGRTERPMKTAAPRYGGKKYTENPEEFYRTKSGNCYDYSDGKSNKRTVWTVATSPFKAAHFATFPPELIKPCILAGCPEGGIVLDPFMGSGTSAVVATLHRRKYIGIELNPEYVKMAQNRIKREGNLTMTLFDMEVA